MMGGGGVAGKRRDKEREHSERGAGCLSWEQVSVQFGVGGGCGGGGGKNPRRSHVWSTGPAGRGESTW